MGGRSRVAAQVLSGKGFKTVYNMSGGIRAWDSQTAVGPQEQGLTLFEGKETPEDVLKVAYSLEQGLREFYLDMEQRSENSKVKNLFSKLSEIEVKHQMSIYRSYCDLAGEEVGKDEFEAMVEKKAMEGGMSTGEYLDMFQPDLNSPVDVVSLAMSIEAQALDLYQRVVQNIDDEGSREIVQQIANEEKAHLASLGKLMDSL